MCCVGRDDECGGRGDQLEQGAARDRDQRKLRLPSGHARCRRDRAEILRRDAARADLGVISRRSRADLGPCVPQLVNMPPVMCDTFHSGLRLVRVSEEGFTHEWFELAYVPDSFDEAFDTHGMTPTKRCALHLQPCA